MRASSPSALRSASPPVDGPPLKRPRSEAHEPDRAAGAIPPPKDDDASPAAAPALRDGWCSAPPKVLPFNPAVMARGEGTLHATVEPLSLIACRTAAVREGRHPLAATRVMITGGSSGVGSATVQQLLALGIPALGVDRKPPAQDGEPHLHVDLSEKGAAAAVMAEAAEKYGVPDALVCSAGLYNCHKLEDFKEEDYAKVLQVNLHSQLEMVRKWLELQGPKQRTLILVGSAAALRGSRDVAYSVSKAGQLGLFRSLNRNLSPDVRCFYLAPGVINTPMASIMPEGRRAEHVSKTHLQRESEPEEIAEVIVSILQGYGGYLAGSVIDLSGGII